MRRLFRGVKLYNNSATSDHSRLAAMALASAALLGVVSTFSWSNVLNADKLKGSWSLVASSENLQKLILLVFGSAAANVEQKQARQQGVQDSSDSDTNTELDHSSVSDFAAFARQEIESLVTGRS